MDFLQKELGIPVQGGQYYPPGHNQHQNQHQGGGQNYMPPQQHVLAKIVNSIQTINMCGPEVHSEAFVSQNTCIASENGAYFAKMQEDGNLVVYCSTHFHHKNALWSSHTNSKGEGPYYLKMQHDGNAVLYDKHEKALWSTKTDGKGQAPYKLKMQNDGNLVLYDSYEQALWNSHTNREGEI